ncbi:MAG: hypothetical protein ABIQ65_06620 [Thermoanaerobaculia bacterium]
MTGRIATGRRIPAKPGLTPKQLDALVEEATIDAHGDSEQISGLFTMIEDNLLLPFDTEVLGVQVTVMRVELTDDERIVALCVKGRHRQRLPILDLPIPTPRPEGAHWIEVYRRWCRHGGR